MAIVWKWSTDSWSAANVFPLPAISIVTNPRTSSTILSLANTGLKGQSILTSSNLYKSFSSTPDKLVEILIYYINPISNTIIGYYLDQTAEYMKSAIDNCAYDLALSSTPILKLYFDTIINEFEGYNNVSN